MIVIASAWLSFFFNIDRVRTFATVALRHFGNFSVKFACHSCTNCRKIRSSRQWLINLSYLSILRWLVTGGRSHLYRARVCRTAITLSIMYDIPECRILHQSSGWIEISRQYDDSVSSELPLTSVCKPLSWSYRVQYKWEVRLLAMGFCQDKW